MTSSSFFPDIRELQLCWKEIDNMASLFNFIIYYVQAFQMIENCALIEKDYSIVRLSLSVVCCIYRLKRKLWLL